MNSEHMSFARESIEGSTGEEASKRMNDPGADCACRNAGEEEGSTTPTTTTNVNGEVAAIVTPPVATTGVFAAADAVVDNIVGRRPVRPHPLLGQLVSRFKSVRSKNPYASITIGAMLAEISDRVHAAKCAAVAAEPDGRKRRTIKTETLEAVTWSGEVTARKEGGVSTLLVSKSGVAMIDFDDLPDPAAFRDRLATLPFILAAWISSSGRGVQALVVMSNWCNDRESHEAFMRWLIASSSEIFGHQADEHCTDLSRLSYESSDANLRINHEAAPYAIDKETCINRTKTPHPVSIATSSKNLATAASEPRLLEMVVSAIRFYAEQGRPVYDLWLRIFSVTLLVMPKEDALSFLKELFPEEAAGEYEEKLKSPLTRITVQSFLAQARVAGWKCPPLIGLTDEAKTYVAKVVYAGRDYMVPTATGYSPMRAMQVRRHLADAGVPLDRIDDTLTHIEKAQSVDAVLDLFGRKAGIHEINGHRLLVSRDTILMASNPGDCTTLRAFLVELFGEGQLIYFVGWLKKARRDFAAGSSAPGQFLIIIGDVKTGKSLLIAILVLMLGGRYASGYSYLMGKSEFNKEIITVGITGLDDELDSTDAATRSKIRARLKAFAFSRKVAVTPKGVDQKTLEPVGRIVIVGNATEEVMQAVPFKTSDMEDKVMLLKAHRVHGGTLDTLMAAGDPLKALQSELPAFLDFVERFEIPADKTDLRTGVAAYWNPELLALMDADAEDAPVIELIEKHRLLLASNNGGRSASDLLSSLLKSDDNARVILGNPTGVSFGKALARVAGNRPDLIRRGRVVHKTARWEVLA